MTRYEQTLLELLTEARRAIDDLRCELKAVRAQFDASDEAALKRAYPHGEACGCDACYEARLQKIQKRLEAEEPAHEPVKITGATRERHIEGSGGITVHRIGCLCQWCQAQEVYEAKEAADCFTRRQEGALQMETLRRGAKPAHDYVDYPYKPEDKLHVTASGFEETTRQRMRRERERDETLRRKAE